MTYRELDADQPGKKQAITEFNRYEICFGFMIAIVCSYFAYDYNAHFILPAFIAGAGIGMNFAYYIRQNVFKKRFQK